MKLAEALLRRSDCQTYLQQLHDRILRNVVIQEGEEPTEDPKVLLKEYIEKREALTALVQDIRRTNEKTVVQNVTLSNGKKLKKDITLGELLAIRDELLDKREMLEEVAREASGKDERYSLSEIKKVAMVDVKALRKKIDEYSKEYRLLDLKIQELNWLVEII